MVNCGLTPSLGSGIWNQGHFAWGLWNAGLWNPKSKTVLDSFTWGNLTLRI